MSTVRRLFRRLCVAGPAWCPAFWPCVVLWVAIAPTAARGVQIEFDYTYDTDGFFDDPQRRELLELAARHVNRYVDPLQAIIPGDGKKWFVFPPLPPSLSDKFVYDLEIPADTIKVLVGGSSILPENNLSQTTAGPGSAVSGPPEWSDLVASRGQVGALETPPTDFGNWGGVINVNSDVKWHFGETTEGLDTDETDFLTLAMHELTHIFGFGPADSFLAQVDLIHMKFNGDQALSVGSGTNPTLRMYDGGHWTSNTLSFLGGVERKALMTPEIYEGERKYPTLLDRAALRDVGWQEARPGDVNLDGLFDTRDIVQVLQADKYLSGDTAAWADGDWNDDFRFDQADVVAALVAGLYLTGPYLATSPAGIAPAAANLAADSVFVPVPEPATWALALSGLLAMAVIACRRCG